MKDASVSIGKIDCTQEKTICSQLEVSILSSDTESREDSFNFLIRKSDLLHCRQLIA